MKRSFFYLAVVCLFLVACNSEDSITLTGLSLEPATLSLIVGDTETLKTIIQPIDATNQLITWASNNQEVATVDVEGKVSAVSPGAAIIMATSHDGGKTASCTVTVHPEISTLFRKRYMTALAGENIPSFVYVDNMATANKSLEWHSDNESVAVVDNRGYIRGLGEGVANITCSAYHGLVCDTFSISFVEWDPFIILRGPYTGLLSYADGEQINSTSAMIIMGLCVDGVDFGYCLYELSLDIEYDGKKMYIYSVDLLLTHSKSAYTLYAEATYEGYPVTVNGAIDPENSSVNLTIHLAREAPVNLVFRGSIKDN